MLHRFFTVLFSDLFYIISIYFYNVRLKRFAPTWQAAPIRLLLSHTDSSRPRLTFSPLRRRRAGQYTGLPKCDYPMDMEMPLL
jgi:hypothetical protein